LEVYDNDFITLGAVDTLLVESLDGFYVDELKLNNIINIG